MFTRGGKKKKPTGRVQTDGKPGKRIGSPAEIAAMKRPNG